MHEKKQKYSQQVAEKKMKKHKISNYTNVSSFYNYHKFTNKSAFLKVTYVKIVVIDAELKKCKHIFNTFLLLATRYNRLPGADGLVVAVCPESHLPPFSDAVTFCPSYSITYKKKSEKSEIYLLCECTLILQERDSFTPTKHVKRYVLVGETSMVVSKLMTI